MGETRRQADDGTRTHELLHGNGAPRRSHSPLDRIVERSAAAREGRFGVGSPAFADVRHPCARKHSPRRERPIVTRSPTSNG